MDLLTKVEGLPQALFANERVSLCKIESDEEISFAVRGCRLRRDQRDQVDPAGVSLGRAWLHPRENIPYIIRNRRNEPVGFLLLCWWSDPAQPALSWSFFIGEKFQHQGYGSAAARCAVAVLRGAFPGVPIKLAVEAGNKKAEALYGSLGFRFWGEHHGDARVFVLN